MTAKNLLQSVRNFADRCFRARRFNGKIEQIALPARCGLRERVKRGLRLGFVAFGAQPVELLDLLFANHGIIDNEHIDRLVRFRLIFVDADNRLHAGVDPRLRPCSGLLDAHFRQAGFNSFGHTAKLFHFLNMRPGFLRQLMCQTFDIIAAAPGIDHAGSAGFLGDEELCVAGDAGREIRRQSKRLVQRIGVKRLRAAMRCGKRLYASANDIVINVLRCEAPAGGLAMRAQRQRLGIFRAEILHDLGPEHPCGAHFGDFHEEVHTDGPEKGQARGKIVNAKSGVHTGAHIIHTVSQRIT